VVISLTRQQFEQAGAPQQFRLQFMQTEEINEMSTSYGDVRPGFKLARFNSSGYMEICINRGRAASLFGLRLGARNNDIKMIFE
jgi:S-adenosylmethionine hydrolase